MLNTWHIRESNEINDILLNLKEYHFYDISYREYVALHKKYIIRIYPFVVDIHEIMKPCDIQQLKYYHPEIFKQIIRIHHVDFINGISFFDPCLIFEEITGQKIHTVSNDFDTNRMFLPKEYYIKQINKINRKMKLEQIRNIA